ncbi:MAG TPA: PD-(D/E)XK nuclease family protein, partial [Myxococcaceae bacterium]|nr:PD-(D/E)XK nuclease family protein [Myxococcaceae bacterium]
ISLAAVLRSPLVALSDASLLLLADVRLLPSPAPLPPLPMDERARLDAFLSLFPRLREERDRLGIRVLLQVAMEETGFRVALAGTAFAEQALANVDKLLDLAERHDARGWGDVASFARELLRLAEEEPREAQADVLDAGDPRAVQLLTIHRAKGLEWPIVVVPDLAGQGPTRTDRALFDRDHGLALKPAVPGESAPVDTERLLRVRGELNRRDAAEGLRTLYVALTRARDRLILSGGMPRAQRGSWRRVLDAAIQSDVRLRAAVVDIDPSEGPPGTAEPQAPESPHAAEDVLRQRVARALDRVRRPPRPGPRELVLAVTPLQDFFLCPRRYFHAHELGLAEHPNVLELREEGESEARGSSHGDPRRRGTLAHALLERVDLSLVREGGRELRQHLEKLLWEAGERPDAAGNQLIVDAVESFLRTSFAARLAGAGEARVYRELPFLLRVGDEHELPALYLKGKIDLLFEDADGSALVLDYKFTRVHPEGLQPYAFQLDCYALAARQLVREGVPIRTGVAFLEERGREPDVRADEALDSAALSPRLLAGARQLLEHSQQGGWPGQPRGECERIRCGYRYRCHGPTC